MCVFFLRCYCSGGYGCSCGCWLGPHLHRKGTDTRTMIILMEKRILPMFYQNLYLFVCLSIYLSIHLSIWLSIYLFIYLSTIYIFILYTFSLKTRRILWPKWPHRSNLKETRGFQAKPGVLPKHILIPRVSIYTRTIVRVSKLRVYKQYVSFWFGTGNLPSNISVSWHSNMSNMQFSSWTPIEVVVKR